MLGTLESKLGKLRSKPGYLYAGYPWFLGLFGRDALISAWQLLDYDSSIARHTLIELAKVQGTKTDMDTCEQPGKIIHEYYPIATTSKMWFKKYKGQTGWLKIGRPEYLSIDSTPLFLIVLAMYHKKVSDEELLSALWPHAKRAAVWIMRYGIYNKFVRYVANDNKLKSQSWKDGIGDFLDNRTSPVAMVEIQGYAYKALKDTAWLSTLMNEGEFGSKLEKCADALKKDFESAFWLNGQQYYAMGIDGVGVPIKAITSNPGHLLFTDILDRQRVKSVVQRLFMKDMFTPYGIRTHSSKDPAFDRYAYQLGSIWPHDNWIIAQGLKHNNYTNKYSKIRSALIKAQTHLKTMPEYFGVDTNGKLIPLNRMSSAPCDPQAWALGAMINMLADKNGPTELS